MAAKLLERFLARGSGASYRTSRKSKAFAARCMTESNNDTGLPVVRHEDQQAYNYRSA